MAYRQFIDNKKKAHYRKDPMYQVIIEDICAVFGYARGSPEYEAFIKAIETGRDPAQPPIEGAQV